MSTVHMMIGIQGSGKTTYSETLSRKYNIPVISSDKVRDDRPDIDPKEIFPEVYRRCSLVIKEGKDLIFDATNITKKVRQRFRDKLKELDCEGFDVIAYYFVPDVDLAVKRVEKRNQMPGERFLPLEVIKDFADNLEVPDDTEGFKEIIEMKGYSIDNK